jgi:hypothetical protein
LFVAAGGYASAVIPRAYQGFYVPVRGWPQAAPQFVVWRRRPKETEFERLWKLYKEKKLPFNWKVNFQLHYNCAMVLSDTLSESTIPGLRLAAKNSSSDHNSYRLTKVGGQERLYLDARNRTAGCTYLYSVADELAYSLAARWKRPDYVILVKSPTKPWNMESKFIKGQTTFLGSIPSISLAEFKKRRETGIMFFQDPYGNADHIDLWDGRNSVGRRIAMEYSPGSGNAGTWLDGLVENGQRRSPVESSKYILFWHLD